MERNDRLTVAALLFALCIVGIGGWTTSAGGQTPTLPVTVRGVAKLDGGAPKPAHIDMSADPQCAKIHPSGAAAQDIVTDGKGGLENVIVFVSAGLEGRSFDSPQEPARMVQKGCMYQPHVLAIRANQKLEVINADPTTHNIHPNPSNNREWNKSQPPGTPLEETFTREEIAIPVKCNVHPWMHSYIAVFKHPYFAVTSADGSFELKDLPAGSYTIEAWHEKLGTIFQKITVAQSETKTLEFDFKPKPGL